MVIERQAITVEQFDKWVNLPENIERDYEFIGGEIHHILAPPKNSVLAARMAAEIFAFVDEHGVGHVTGANGGYKVMNERYIPDVGYISYAKMPELLSEDGYVPAAPDLAVEVLSPSNSEREMRLKLGNYLAAGTTVWIVDPDTKEIEVFAPNESVKTYRLSDTLAGGKVLAGFSLPLKAIFK